MTDPTRRVGTFSVRVEVGDPEGRRFIAVDAQVDTGATLTVLPATLLRSLGVAPYRSGTFELADGTVHDFQTGHTWVRVEGRMEMTPVVFGEQDMPALLGAVTLEQLAFAVDPVEQKLVSRNYLLLSLRRAA